MFPCIAKDPGRKAFECGGAAGIAKKGAMLLLVLLAAALDRAMGTEAARLGVIYFLSGNEGISILENIGLMGVPLPPGLREAFEALHRKGG